MTNILQKYRSQSSQQEGNKPATNILQKYRQELKAPQEELKGDPMDIARERIKKQYPNMPDWLREGILKITPEESNPTLDSAARGFSDVTNMIPAAAGGLLQGASIPIRGIAELGNNQLNNVLNKLSEPAQQMDKAQGMEPQLPPQDLLKKLAQSPNLTGLFPEPEGLAQKTAQLGGEFVGAGAAFNPLVRGGQLASQALRVPQMLEAPLSLGAAGAIGTPGDTKERLTSGAIGAAIGSPQAIGAAAGAAGQALPDTLRRVLTKVNPRELVQRVRDLHDDLFRESTGLFDHVGEQAVERGIANVPIEEEVIDHARRYLEHNRPNEDLIERARTGDFEALRSLQSELKRIARDRFRDPSSPVRESARTIDDIAEQVNESITNHFNNTGNQDLAEALTQARNVYRQMKQRYYEPNRQLAALVDPYKRAIPKDIMNLFSKEDEGMAAFRHHHPEIQDAVEHHQFRKEMTKRLSKYGKAALYTGLGLTGATAPILLIKQLLKD